MTKKTILLLILAFGLIVGVILMLFRLQQKNPLSTPVTGQQQSIQVLPSDTLKTYTDPAGITFSYPDNLSLVNNEPSDSSNYVDLLLSAKGVDGSLAVKIADSQLSSLDEWVKKTQSSQNPKEAKLGNLKAMEVTTNDQLWLGALDQGVLFTIEVSLADRKDFWMKVYEKVLENFSFVSPQEAVTPSDDVTFEGEEVVE